jgi:predicted metal-dependent hydrolase
VLEDLWRPLPPGPEKQLLQGILQVGVGFHHLKNGNYAGARNLLSSGLERLDDVASHTAYAPPIPVEPLIHSSRKALQTLLTLGPEQLAHFPASLIPCIEQRR